MNDALTNSIRYPLAALALAVACGNGAAADDFINVRNPVTLPVRIAAQRVPVGITGDYKPCLGLLSSGELLMVNYYYKPETGDGKSRPEMILHRSQDGGKTWGKRQVLSLLGLEGYFSVLKDGTLFITSVIMYDDIRNPDGYIRCFLHRSTDEGHTWTTLKIVSQDIPGAGEKTWTVTSRNVLELDDGSLILGVSAGSSIDYLWRSRDLGKTWDKTLASSVEGFDVTKQGFPWYAETVFMKSGNGDILGIARCNEHALPPLAGTKLPPKEGGGTERMALFRSRDGGKTWTLEPEMGNYYGEHYQALLRLRDGRLLLTFTVRSLKPPLGVQAVLGVETKDGFVLDFKKDRLILDEKTPADQSSGGGFGGTVQLEDDTLVTAYSYRGADSQFHVEVIRWRLP